MEQLNESKKKFRQLQQQDPIHLQNRFQDLQDIQANEEAQGQALKGDNLDVKDLNKGTGPRRLSMTIITTLQTRQITMNMDHTVDTDGQEDQANQEYLASEDHLWELRRNTQIMTTQQHLVLEVATTMYLQIDLNQGGLDFEPQEALEAQGGRVVLEGQEGLQAHHFQAACCKEDFVADLEVQAVLAVQVV